MVPRPGTGHVQQLALGVIDLLQAGIITGGLNTPLQGNNLVIVIAMPSTPSLITSLVWGLKTANSSGRINRMSVPKSTRRHHVERR